MGRVRRAGGLGAALITVSLAVPAAASGHPVQTPPGTASRPVLSAAE